MEPDLGRGHNTTAHTDAGAAVGSGVRRAAASAPTAEVGGDVGLAAEGTHPVDALRDAREQVVAPAPFLPGRRPQRTDAEKRRRVVVDDREESESVTGDALDDVAEPPVDAGRAHDLDAERVAASEEYALFWSLSFALTPETWRRIGGFDEAYEGYGGEDTDFAFRMRAQGVPLVWTGGAHAYHQYHQTSSPPWQHLDDILRNGALFHERWGEWPMTGWLDAFERGGGVIRYADGWRRAPAEGGV
ncbi:hypothetical protein MMM2322_00361 [Microbacterium sp. MM2322]